MKRIPKLREELTEEELRNQEPDSVTLDGYVFVSKDVYSYDNDFDSTLPSILTRVKNPDESERRKSAPRKKFFFPRQALKYQVQNIQFWEERKENLSEVLSRWPQLSLRIKGLGRSTAKDLVCLFVYLNHQGKKLLEVPGGEEISEIIISKCKQHLLEGEWRYLASLLQLANAPKLLDERIHQRLTKRDIFGNLLPRGKKIYEQQIQLELTCYPVHYSKRKRGHRDSHSGNSAHLTKTEYREPIGKLEITRELKILRGKDLILQYLYGYSAPVMEPILTDLEKEYRKRINKQKKQKRKLEEKRSKILNSEVKISWSKDRKK